MPVSNILDKEDYKTNVRYTGARLMFAEIAANEDLLMTLATRRRTGECVRFDSISLLSEKTTMNSVGDTVCTAFDEYLQFDLVPAAHRGKFKEYTDLNSKQPGRNMVRGQKVSRVTSKVTRLFCYTGIRFA